MSQNACIANLLLRGLDDWIDAAEVAWVAKSIGGGESYETILDLSLWSIRALLDESLAEVGMVTREHGFVAWDTPPADSMARIEAEWRTKPRGPDLGEVCWLSLTEAGRARAEAVLAER